MEYLFYVFIFIFGAIIGSFLNVVLYRHNTELTLFGRSFCFSCSRQLTWRELFPIVSYLTLGGRCRFCKSKIASQYSWVEAGMGTLSVLLFWKLGGFVTFTEKVYSLSGIDWMWVFSALVLFFIFAILLLIVVYDLKHKIIPDIFSYLFAALAFLKLLFLPETFPFILTIWDLFAGIILAAPFAFLWTVSQGRWMGWGDVKLALGIGWFLGLKAGLSAIILAFWIGALFGVSLIVFGKFQKTPLFGHRVSMKSEVPFAPFLILGLLITFFFPSAVNSLVVLYF